jgi:hypothetical protein
MTLGNMWALTVRSLSVPKKDGGVRLFSRRGCDWTARYPLKPRLFVRKATKIPRQGWGNMVIKG